MTVLSTSITLLLFFCCKIPSNRSSKIKPVLWMPNPSRVFLFGVSVMSCDWWWQWRRGSRNRAFLMSAHSRSFEQSFLCQSSLRFYSEWTKSFKKTSTLNFSFWPIYLKVLFLFWRFKKLDYFPEPTFSLFCEWTSLE